MRSYVIIGLKFIALGHAVVHIVGDVVIHVIVLIYESGPQIIHITPMQFYIPQTLPLRFNPPS